jgi:hypothetical protein
VDVYNPFESPSFKQETPSPASLQPPLRTPPSTPSSLLSPRQPAASDSNPPELRFREEEETENFYKDESGDNETSGINPPMMSTRLTGTARVTVKQQDDDTINFWQMKFYRRFFNIDSMEVLKRCVRSLWPFKYDFLATIKDNPDFYGPFWISTTLIFMMAAAANFAYYLDALINPDKIYQYDFYKLIYGSGVIYGYAFITPLLFWLYVKWIELNINLIDILCIYGYSLFVYSPVALLCIIPNDLAKWIVVGIGCLFSTAFLVVNLWMPLRERLTYGIICLIVITALHLGLALTFRLYFFNLSNQ